jgi:hypothetical protein
MDAWGNGTGGGKLIGATRFGGLKNLQNIEIYIIFYWTGQVWPSAVSW